MKYSFKPRSVGSKSSVTVQRGPVYNIIVLVAGTSDPSNMKANPRANSYPSRTDDTVDASYYWKHDKGFLDSIHKLEEDLKRYNVSVFDVHGWTGDNSAAHRKRAGEYLVDRLCGSNGEEAYYEGYKKKLVQFHLIGHSHGGNVINEMTARMAACPDWPKTWSVKTIAYLSVPFFRCTHWVDTTKLHEECKLLNVYNDFDVTQRVIASFSLRQTPGIEDVSAQAANLGCLFEELTRVDTRMIGIFALAFMSSTSTEVNLKDPELDDIWGWLKDYLEGRHFIGIKRVFRRFMRKTSWMLPEFGRKLYEECLKRFALLAEIFDAVQQVIDELARKRSYDIAKGLEGKMSAETELISQGLHERFRKALAEIRVGLSPTILAFQTRLLQDKYPCSGFIDDIHLNAFLRPLVEFIRINPPEEDGRLTDETVPKDSLFDLLVEILWERIETFETVKNDPEFQLKGTSFERKVRPIPVTHTDPYFDCSPVIKSNGKAFIDKLEAAARRFEKSRTRTDLLDMLFILIAQLEGVHSMMGDSHHIGYVLAVLAVLDVGDDGFEQITEDLLDIFGYYRTVLNARTYGKEGIVVTTDQPDPTNDVFKRGDLAYLMVTSHSISRRPLDAEVIEILKEQIMKEKGYEWPPLAPKNWMLIGPGCEEH